jgi:hypothetical protein
MITKEERELFELLQDAYDIITALDDPDCEAWIGQAKTTLERERNRVRMNYLATGSVQ